MDCFDTVAVSCACVYYFFGEDLSLRHNNEPFA